jgi:hypothetical protein
VTIPEDKLSSTLAATAGHGLTATATMFPEAALEDQDWGELIDSVLSERLEGHLASAIADGSLPATVSQSREASLRHIDAMALAVTLESTLLEAADLFDDASIDFRVLKGSASAHLDYPDPASRVFGDIDLLVRGEQFDEAAAALTGAGYVRRTPEPRPGFDRRFGKGAVFTGPRGFEIDLHRTFVAGPFGISVDLKELWKHEASFSIAGRTLHALGREERFLNACYHAVLGDSPPRLNPQRDIAQMLQTRLLDFERVRALADAWHSSVVVARALQLVWETFLLGDANAISVWAQSYEPTRREERDLIAYTGEHSTYVTKSLAGVRTVPGVRLKAAYLLALGLPSRRYLRQRGTTASARWRRGLGEATVSRGDG